MGRKKKTLEIFDYNKQTLTDIFNSIKITMGDGFTKTLASGKKVQAYTVSTMFNGSKVSEVEVSNRYEIFDFSKFAINALTELEKSFNIKSYTYLIIGGIQEFRLFSDEVEINGRKFVKTFYLLNSSDRLRKTNLDYGLYCKESDYHFISKSVNISKRHYNGITEHISENIIYDSNIFDEQIDILKEMANSYITISNLHRVILNPSVEVTKEWWNEATAENINKSNHTKFDIYKRKLIGLCEENKHIQTSNKYNIVELLETHSTELMNKWGDINIGFNVLDVFEKYLTLYATRDSFVIKTESEYFLRANDFYVREAKLRELLASLD
jgi:hypothetical protein